VKRWILIITPILFISSALFIAGKKADSSDILNIPHGKMFVPAIPVEPSFAGERVPMKDADVIERFDKELLVNTFWHSNTILMLKRANRYLPQIEAVLKKNGVPDDFKYLCVIESGLSNVVSPAGAAGFWQFLESTGKKYGLEINEEVDERYNLEKATEAACAYLKANYYRFGSWTLAAAAYNMGESGVERQLKAQGVKSYYDLYLNQETSRYIFRMLATKEILSNPDNFGFMLDSDQLYTPINTRIIEVDSTIVNWAQFALDNGSNYKHLKLLNPWIRDPMLKNKSMKTYQVKLPAIPLKNDGDVDETIPAEE
jgi:hypothetical protein